MSWNHKLNSRGKVCPTSTGLYMVITLIRLDAQIISIPFVEMYYGYYIKSKAGEVSS